MQKRSLPSTAAPYRRADAFPVPGYRGQRSIRQRRGLLRPDGYPTRTNTGSEEGSSSACRSTYQVESRSVKKMAGCASTREGAGQSRSQQPAERNATEREEPRQGSSNLTGLGKLLGSALFRTQGGPYTTERTSNNFCPTCEGTQSNRRPDLPVIKLAHELLLVDRLRRRRPRRSLIEHRRRES